MSDKADDYRFAPARNDPILNSFPHRWIVFQRANMDIKPCLSKHALVQYLTKYCTKDEPCSDTLKTVTEKLLQQQPAGAEPVGAGQVYTRVLMNTVGSRDITAQEVVHHALQLPALLTSATFATATLNEREVTAGGAVQKSVWQKYTERPSTELINEMSFVEYLRRYNLDTHRPRRHAAVPRIFPRLRVTGPDDVKFEQWCHQQLRVYKPCRSDAELRPDPAISWAVTLQNWISSGGVVPQKVQDVIQGHQPQTEMDEEEDTEEEEEEGNDEEAQNAAEPEDAQEDWILAGRAEQLLVNGESEADTDQADWHAYWRSMNELATGADTFIKEAQNRHEVTFTPPHEAQPGLFNAEQKKAFDILISAIRKEIDPVRVLVSGTAGSGKSFLIMCFRRSCLDEFGDESITMYASVRLPEQQHLI